MRIGITGIGSVSALGSTREAVWESYLNNDTLIRQDAKSGELTCPINQKEENQLAKLRTTNKNYQGLDRSVLLAILAGEQAVKMANWNKEKNFGINIGSSRGATNSFELHHQYFLNNRKAETQSSPSTTLGNISYWLANHLDNNGPLISHSITCSTASHSILNAIAWLKSGMNNAFLVGGTEAPLTDFTIAQMKALRIYANRNKSKFPCQALQLEKEFNTMVLGEGAACFCLETNPEKPIAWIEGFGYGREEIAHATYLSKSGECLQTAMQMALADHDLKEIDVVLTHTPGTRHGDRAEYKAIQTVFKNNMPYITTNKWKIGHTLGASAGFSLEMALLMMEKNHLISVPYLPKQDYNNREIKKVLVNAVGFGGNAVSILLSKP